MCLHTVLLESRLTLTKDKLKVNRSVEFCHIRKFNWKLIIQTQILRTSNILLNLDEKLPSLKSEIFASPGLV